MATEIARDVFGYKYVRGNWIEPNMESVIQNGDEGRGDNEFRANRIENPSGGSGTKLNTDAFLTTR